MENPDVAWAARAREGVWAPTKDGQRIHIGIECTAGDRPATVVRPSLRVFVGVEVDTDIVAQTTDSGIEQDQPERRKEEELRIALWTVPDDPIRRTGRAGDRTQLRAKAAGLLRDPRAPRAREWLGSAKIVAMTARSCSACCSVVP